MPNSPLTLYKASAGSGKTFMLAVRYIALLVQNPNAYKEILAVTFTNKATAEMKQRILSQLYGISHGLGDSEDYFNKVREFIPASVSDSHIRKNAAEALENILQDYGHFRIETIDSFFQSVLRSLARELQLGGSLTLELDTGTVISDAVDTFLSELKDNSPERSQVIRFIEDNMDDGQNWSVDTRLKEFSSQLFRETFMQNAALLKKCMAEPGAVAEFAALLRNEREKKADEILEKTVGCGQKLKHEASAFDGALSANVQKLIDSIAEGVFLDKAPGKTISNVIEEPEKAIPAAARKKNPALVTDFAMTMVPLFSTALQLHAENSNTANSFDAALKYLHEAGLLMDVRREINRQNEEAGRFLLADTANLLGNMQEGDTSFVFEKTGSYIRHLMIDEFQDTSKLQWKNLCILLMECLSQGRPCLVVGDVKQSIYRWRDSDWNIFNTGIEEKTALYRPVTEPLVINRRSCRRIIDFNNKVFPKAVEALSARYAEEFGVPHPSLEKAYSKMEQICAAKADEGYVKVKLPSAGAADMFSMIEEELDRLTEAGVRPSDITILCRKKKHIGEIAEYFQTQCTRYRMESGEAFRLDASVQVRIITGMLHWIADEADTLSLAHALWEWRHYVMKDDATMQQVLGDADNLPCQLPALLLAQKDILRRLPLQELVTRLFGLLELDRYEGQDAYFFSFLDTLSAWTAHNPSDLDGFLTAWDDSLCETRIPAAESDGVRLMTVHKAKGLEFHTVIIPFCNWEMVSYSGPRTPNRLWAHTEAEPFGRMPLIPVDFSKGLKDSVFIDSFREEYGMQMVDNLNLLYVALTRPACNMCILCEARNGYTSATLLEGAMAAAGLISDGDTEFTDGKPVAHREKEENKSKNPFRSKSAEEPVSMKIHGLTAEFQQSGQSERFVNADAGARQEEYIESGKLMHRLFSAISTEADVDNEVKAILDEGLLGSPAEADALTAKVHRYLQKPEVKDWFSGRYRLYNETAVIFRRNGVLQTRRPDRVMTDGDTAIVVDFKFGTEREDYMRQVQEYMELLSSMGYKKVSGYIWYVNLDKTINC